LIEPFQGIKSPYQGKFPPDQGRALGLAFSSKDGTGRASLNALAANLVRSITRRSSGRELFAAVIVSVLALVISVFGRSAIGRRGIAVAMLALAAGGLTAYVPWHYRALARSVPPIHDITTDTDNPPAFIAVIKLREAEDRQITPGGAPTLLPGFRQLI
jgi:hypothetical protein